MTTLAAVGRRVLPRGWGDLAKQLAIWFGFLFAYQAARGIADRNPPKAFDNGLKVIGFERHMHGLIELSFQRFVDSSQFLILATARYSAPEEFMNVPSDVAGSASVRDAGPHSA